MIEFKPILQSKTVWSGILTVIAGIAGVYGISIGANLDFLPSAFTILTGAYSIYGRIIAKHRLLLPPANLAPPTPTSKE